MVVDKVLVSDRKVLIRKVQVSNKMSLVRSRVVCRLVMSKKRKT